MRFVMSLLRIAFGVSVGVGYFAGMAYLPRPFPGILFCLFIWLFSGAFFFVSFRALRTGRLAVNAGGHFLVYERKSFEYWFYNLLIILMGLLALWAGLSALFPSRFHLF